MSLPNLPYNDEGVLLTEKGIAATKNKGKCEEYPSKVTAED